MKTMNKILIMSAMALAMAAVPNVKADGALLSPRAQGNEIKIASLPDAVGTDTTVVAPNKIMANPGALLSPRAQANQIVKVAGTNNDPDLVLLGQTSSEYSAYVSPRARTQQPAPVYQVAPVK
jgi:hypothetical protein